MAITLELSLKQLPEFVETLKKIAFTLLESVDLHQVLDDGMP
jgi:hypothetical protein